MRLPAKGEQLRSASGEIWIVVRSHPGRGDEFSVDLIRQQDLKPTSQSLNLTLGEFADFCRREGIVYG